MSGMKEKKTGDLVDRMRRLSIGSEGSSISIISPAPSVHSINSGEGGVTVNVAVPKVENEDDKGGKKKEKKKKAKNIGKETSSAATQSEVDNATAASKNNGSTSSKNDISTTLKDNNSASKSKALASPRGSTSSANSIHCSPFWLQFPNFVPDPSATFKTEFKRLSKSQGWGTSKQKRIEALNAEVAFHWNVSGDALKSLQQLCSDVGLTVIPSSVTQCKKVLKPIFINIHNLIDHRRNPKGIALLKFKNYAEFWRYTSKSSHRFPKNCAKNGFVKVMLREL